jgi:homoserine kinase type II
VGTFTSLDDADVVALAAQLGLGAIEHWRPITAGTINSNFELTTARGRIFLRVNEGKSEADVAWEAELAAHLAATGVPTPVPMTAADGRRFAAHRGLLVSAFAWLRGHHLVDSEVTPAAAVQIGAALARIHLAGSAFAGERRAGIYTWPLIRDRFEAIRGVGDPALAHAVAILADELAVIDARAAERAAAPQSIIHGDLFRDNVLFDDGRLVALLDFEQASAGAPVYDLAVAINDWCWSHGSPRHDIAAALIAGYEGERPLTTAERTLLPLEVRAAAVRFTITRITDVYLPGIANPDKDFRAFLARVEAWRAAEAAPPLARVAGGGE